MSRKYRMIIHSILLTICFVGFVSTILGIDGFPKEKHGAFMFLVSIFLTMAGTMVNIFNLVQYGTRVGDDDYIKLLKAAKTDPSAKRLLESEHPDRPWAYQYSEWNRDNGRDDGEDDRITKLQEEVGLNGNVYEGTVDDPTSSNRTLLS